MKFMGSKSRIAKEIIPIILNGNENKEYFYDLTVGGCNLLDKIPNSYKRIGVDIDEYLIKALELIRDELYTLPKDYTEFNESDYKEVMNFGNVGIGFKGYVGYQLSYGGKWFGGYRRDKVGDRDYVKEAYNNSVKQSELIQDIEFIHSSYDKVELNKNSIIYIDPPYANTTKYKNKFDHDKFWSWVRKMSKDGYIIFISEYNAPSDFKCIWSKEITSSLTKNTGGKKGMEKLFIYDSESTTN